MIREGFLQGEYETPYALLNNHCREENGKVNISLYNLTKTKYKLKSGLRNKFLPTVSTYS
jgi:hypothetical protein